jgi:hypothetical protein
MDSLKDISNTYREIAESTLNFRRMANEVNNTYKNLEELILRARIEPIKAFEADMSEPSTPNVP